MAVAGNLGGMEGAQLVAHSTALKQISQRAGCCTIAKKLFCKQI